MLPEFRTLLTINIEWDFKWKRNLVEHAFSGVDSAGKRLGVYLDYVDGQWSFEVRGLVETTVKALPLSDLELADIKSNMLGLVCPQEYCKLRYFNTREVMAMLSLSISW